MKGNTTEGAIRPLPDEGYSIPSIEDENAFIMD